jgi:hypothetical protein
MGAVVVETNVMMVANGKADQAGPKHIQACSAALEKAKSTQVIVIDSRNRIFEEYFRLMSHSGQPGLGDAFAKWLFENQGHADRCERVDITPKPGAVDDFEEFPDDPELKAFDPSDRKFVAVAVASAHNPQILNATDSDWWISRAPLKKHGIRIRFLCPDLMPAS